MVKKPVSPIFENAIDSLVMGIRNYTDRELDSSNKWAILEVFHAVELFLKERLFQEHRLLIYRHIDKPIGDDAQTVGLQETLTRFTNIGVALPEKYVGILKDLQKHRNRIEHSHYKADPSHSHLVGQALQFIGFFVEEHLQQDLETHLTTDVFKHVKELLIEYDLLIARAEGAMSKALEKVRYREQDLIDKAHCPECGNETVLIGLEEQPYCYFCEASIYGLSRCSYCAEFLPESDFLLDTGICRSCFDYKISKD